MRSDFSLNINLLIQRIKTKYFVYVWLIHGARGLLNRNKKIEVKVC